MDVFVVYTGDVKDWSASITKGIKPSSRVMIVEDEMHPLPKTATKRFDEQRMLGVQYINAPIDLDSIDALEELSNQIKMMLVECSEEPDLYFVGTTMESFYGEMKEEMTQFAKNVAYNKTFQVSRAKKESSEDFQTGPKKGEQLTLESGLLEGLNAGALLAGIPEASKENTSSAPPPTQNSSPQQNKDEGRTPPPFTPRNNRPAPPRHNRNGNNNVQQAAPQEKGEQQMLEDEVLGKDYVDGIYSQDFTQLENAKAIISNELSKRFAHHVFLIFKRKNTQLPSDCKLTVSQTWEYFLLMLKTNGIKEFNEQIKTAIPSTPFIFLDTIFAIENDECAEYKEIKDEAYYLNELITLMYEKDKWNH